MPARNGCEEQRVAGNAIDGGCVTVERQTVAGRDAACEVEQEGVAVLPEIRFARRQAHGDPQKKRRRRDRHQPGAQRSIQRTRSSHSTATRKCNHEDAKTRPASAKSYGGPPTTFARGCGGPP